jgi:hypothetical protein
MKKAFLVTATIKTRVVVDVDENYNGGTYNACYFPNEDEDKIITEALPRLKDNVCEENVDSIELDTEFPYDEEFDD